jgi:hypothetical protein
MARQKSAFIIPIRQVYEEGPYEKIRTAKWEREITPEWEERRYSIVVPCFETFLAGGTAHRPFKNYGSESST